MEDDHEPQETKATPASAPKTMVTATAGKGPSAADRRVERIEEYLEQSLEKKDPLQANLGAAAAHLMFIQYRMAESIKAAMGTRPITMDELREDFCPAISSLALVDRQIVRYGQLGNELNPRETHRRGAKPSRTD